MQSVRIGVIGIGNMGSAHAVCVAQGEIKGLVLTAVCDLDEQRRKGPKKKKVNNNNKKKPHITIVKGIRILNQARFQR